MNADELTLVPPPMAEDEHHTLAGFLDFYRTALLRKVAGLDDEPLSRPMTLSGTSLLGIVKHLAHAESYWFEVVFLGEATALPPIATDPEVARRVEPGETADEIISLYQEKAARSREIVLAAAPGDLARGQTERGSKPTLRWIMLHVIEETARLCGHADILRERVDGATGY